MSEQVRVEIRITCEDGSERGWVDRCPLQGASATIWSLAKSAESDLRTHPYLWYKPHAKATP